MRPPPPPIPDLLRLSVWPFALAAAAVSLCYAAAGETLGFYIGPVLALTLILPVMVTPHARHVDAVVAAGAMVDAVGLAWLLAVFGPNLTFLQWLQCYLILAAYAFALTGVARATAAWVAIVVGVAWLTWATWTSSFLNNTLARWLTPAHPLMAMNNVVLNHGGWTEQPLMYYYGTLNQNVTYKLPESIWPCVFVHALIGLLLLGPGWWRARARGRSRRSEAAAESTAAPSA